MIRLYKYLIYRVYSWRLQQNDDNPAWSVIFLLSVVHFFQLLTIFFLVTKYIYPNNFRFSTNRLFNLLFTIIFTCLNYFLFYNKKRWEKYIEEYDFESEKEKTKEQQ